MGLEEYRRKRDFQRTPEPAGGPENAGAGDGLAFIVQKHDASHLHYDFRLELDGTLKSWAVPKGPSLDPSVKRLAMHVEDHPLDYGDFEGIIPEGEYGGGTVLLWDRGTWRPVGDASSSYRRGRLKFDLEGEKLRGRWNLVRTRGEGDGGGKESWLLIKERDAEARRSAETDILEERPESVATGRVLEEIAEDRDRVWRSNREGGGSSRSSRLARRSRAAAKVLARAAAPDPAEVEGARKAALPKKPKAQLATLVTDVPPGDEWVHEIKFDGYRLLCIRDGDEVRLITRNEKDWTDRFGGIAEAIRALPVGSAVIDGEAVVLNEKGVSDFQALQNALGRKRSTDVLFYAFDLLHLDDYDVTRAPLAERKRLLERLVETGRDARVRYADHVTGNGRAFLDQACEVGVEGIISKRADAPYRPGRGRDWLKIKCLRRQEFVVIGFTDPGGSREGFGALLLGVNDDEGRLVSAGRVGTGFSDRTLRELRKRLDRIERKTPPIQNPPRGASTRDIHWVEPELVAEVSFAEWTSDGVIRHPSFHGLREDKSPAEVVREDGAPQPRRRATRGSERGNPATRTRARASRAGGNKEDELRVAGIRITNADRVLYEDVGVTKGDLALYWESVAARALPHLEDRPLTLVRCPKGPAEPCFYQKHWGDGMPETVPRVQIEERDGAEPYMYIDGLPAVIALVQFGVIEFHVWNARRDRLDRPDQLIFDLDPDEALPWQAVVEAAVALRMRLESLGLRSFVKTTGGKGLHVVAPLTRRSDWDEVRDFTRAIAEQFARAAPRRFTAVMSKRQRKGRIFLDYLRNARNSTAVAAYSPRARPGAAVSLPVAWDELESSRERPVFTVREVMDRIASRSADPWRDFSTTQQSITAAALRELGLR